MSRPIDASIVIAGDIELAPDAPGLSPTVVERAVLIQFDTVEDLERFARDLPPIRALWSFDRIPSPEAPCRLEEAS